MPKLRDCLQRLHSPCTLTDPEAFAHAVAVALPIAVAAACADDMALPPPRTCIASRAVRWVLIILLRCLPCCNVSRLTLVTLLGIVGRSIQLFILLWEDTISLEDKCRERTSENALDTAETMASFDSAVAPLAAEPMDVTVPAIQEAQL